MMGNINAILSSLQKNLKAPKNQYNEFGKYTYRNCEDILESLKPLLNELQATVILSDEMVDIGGRIYVKATATLRYEDETISTTAYAREAETKKGMDESQITGATSSYARKYALNGLFAIDDNKDADSTNTHGKDEKPSTSAPKAVSPKPSANTAPPFDSPQTRPQPSSLPPMTLDEAYAMDATYGEYKGFNLKAVFMSNPKDLNFIFTEAKKANNITLIQAIGVIASANKR